VRLQGSGTLLANPLLPCPFRRWLFSPAPLGQGFPFPVLTTTVHMFFQSGIAVLIARVMRWSKRSAAGGRREPELSDAAVAGWREYLVIIGPISFFLGTDIALTNTSFMYLQASFVEMVKPSSNILVFVASVALGLRKPALVTALTVLLMTLGQFLIDFSASRFDLKGFIIVMLAAAMGAARNVLIECRMHGTGIGIGGRRKLNSLEMMQKVMPGAGFILLFVLLVPYKQTSRLCDEYPHFCPEKAGPFVSELQLMFQPPFWEAIVPLGAAVIAGASLAFLLNMSEFLLYGIGLSALTMQSAGLVKLMLLFVATSEAFNEHINARQGLGIAMGMAGVAVYNVYTHLEKQDQTFREGCADLIGWFRQAAKPGGLSSRGRPYTQLTAQAGAELELGPRSPPADRAVGSLAED